MTEQPKVIIRCLVYNHEPYLRDCLEGFVMQKTNFPFKAVVHDDCSTDGSAAIILEYAEKYPHIIEPIYETENQYSKRDGSLRRVMDAASLGRSPYIAYCEGDDYWIDPFKLQKQVDYMDAHPECTLIATHAKILFQDEFLDEKEIKQMGWWMEDKSRSVSIEEVIETAAAKLHTCTVMCRNNILARMPKYTVGCCVGDYPLQIFAALQGEVYYLKDTTAVYRYQALNSWTLKNKQNEGRSTDKSLKSWYTLVSMLEGMNHYSQRKYEGYFRKMEVQCIMWRLIKNRQLVHNVLENKNYRRIFFSYYHKKEYDMLNMNKTKLFLLKLRYYPFYPLCRSWNMIVREMSLFTRVLFAFKYLFSFRKYKCK